MGLMDAGVAEDMVSLITKSFRCDRRDVSYEFQDDWNFILISVAVSEIRKLQESSTREKIARLIDDISPKRTGEYTWMMNFVCGTAIFDSYFGGDSIHPESGL